MKNILLTLTFISLLTACANDASTNEKGESKSGDKNTSIEITPCDLVSEAEIKAICGIPDDVSAEIENTKRTYPTCFYKWSDFKYPMTMDIGGNEAIIDREAEITVVLVKNATKAMFETSTSVYKDGETQSIGEMAIWGEKMSQLTFLANGYMIHLNVKMSADKENNKKQALQIAGIMTKNLQ